MKKRDTDRLSTGLQGLDEVLCGGLVPRRAFLVRGGAGTGKTTLGLHFLLAGRDAKERCLFITLSEPEEEIRRNAQSLGMDMKGVHFLDLSPTSSFFAQVETYDLFSAADVEREPTTKRIIEEVEKVRPQRVFIDSMTQFRYLAQDPFQYRKQVLSFLRYLTEHGCTVMFTSEHSQEAPDADLQFICDGVIEMELNPTGRALSVTKFRGSPCKLGRHAVELTSRGLEVYPKLVPEEHRAEFPREKVPSGIPELDELLKGGIDKGTVTIVSGPSGVGKTTLAMQFAKEAAGRGRRSVLYTFEEAVDTLIQRCEGINLPLQEMVQKGSLAIVQVEPLRHSAHKFASMVRKEVEEAGSGILVIDSVAGYRLSLLGEDLASHLHALCKYLSNMGVTAFLINEVESIIGDFRATEAGISHIADNILFLRYLELKGEIRRAVGVLKKRMSDFEKTLREFEITRYGIKVGRPLTELRGILRGTPEWVQ